MRFYFEDQVLDVPRRELSRARAPILVEPKAFDLLVYLIENRHRLVTKDDLIERIWDGRIVSDSALTSAINSARKAVGDSGQEQRLIRTSARKGFRFVGDVRLEDKPASVMSVPSTRYARSGDVNIAYQVMGDGAVDLILVPGVISHVEYAHELPGYTAALNRLARFARVITFDKRGQGLSDKVSESTTLEDRIDDVRAVMEAVGSHSAFLMGFSAGGAMSVVFTVTYPERVRGLILYGSLLQSRLRDPETLERRIADRTAQWGTGTFMKAVAASRRPIDTETAERFGRFERLSASPGSVKSNLLLNSRLDVSAVLGSVRVPTLVLHRQADIICPIEGSRQIAELIPGAQLVEYPDGDHAFWTGDVEALLADIQEFVSGRSEGAPRVDRMLATVLSLGTMLAKGDVRSYRSLIENHRGNLMKVANDGLLATFDSPSRAVRCALGLTRMESESGQLPCVGLHVGEIEPRQQEPCGIAFDIARSMMHQSQPGEVLVTRVVTDLVADTGLRFAQRGSHEFPDLLGQWELYAARR